MKKSTLFLFFIFILAYSIRASATENNLRWEVDSSNSISVEVNFSELIINKVPFKIEFSVATPLEENQEVPIFINGKTDTLVFIDQKAEIQHVVRGKEVTRISISNSQIDNPINPIPLWTSIIPPLLAILFALLFKEVFSALLLGVFSGSLLISFYTVKNPFIAIGDAFFNIITDFLVPAINDSGHISIIVFSMLISGTVTIISRNGGVNGIVKLLSRFAKSALSGQFVTWLMGIFIFFDDYANTLIVGNTMRPVTDRLKISREKLAYIVDSTAAPVASLALITTWIGVELSYIQDGIDKIGLNASAYGMFLQSLDTRYYLIYTLFFILFIVLLKRDFGPMYKAEKKARSGIIVSHISQNEELDDLESNTTTKVRWVNAVVPIFVIVATTMIALYITGKKGSSTEAGIFTIIGNADSYKALLWASFLGISTAIIMSISQRILNLRQSLEAAIKGFSIMLTAILILILAWALAAVTEHLHTADFITNLLLSIEMSPAILPTITFILAALIAISTGSSWGTMAILYPLILPASYQISTLSGLAEPETMNIFYNVISAVLAGAVLGDHCSPISDTTILSSLASSCNHIEHVRTQMPYALTVGAISIVFGILPSSYGFSSWYILPIGIIVLFLSVRFLGKRIEET